MKSFEAACKFSQLRTTRVKLLELMTDPGNDLETVEAEFTKYMGLLAG